MRKSISFEETFRHFVDSGDFKECILNHLCHTRNWHYDHQTLKVVLFPDGTWKVPSDHSWAKKGECIVTLRQTSYHFRKMEEIGEERDFEGILAADPGEARIVAERLYACQEASVKQGAMSQFSWMSERG